MYFLSEMLAFQSHSLAKSGSGGSGRHIIEMYVQAKLNWGKSHTAKTAKATVLQIVQVTCPLSNVQSSTLDSFLIPGETTMSNFGPVKFYGIVIQSSLGICYRKTRVDWTVQIYSDIYIKYLYFRCILKNVSYLINEID